MEISPAYRMDLVRTISNELLEKYKSYDETEEYLKLWKIDYGDFHSNFYIYRQIHNEYYPETIDLIKTLSSIAKEDSELLLKIAIDLGIETPDFIPSIPMFRNKLKSDYKNASKSFEKAFHNIEIDPAESVGNANSVLESIMKEILSDSRFRNIDSTNKTSGKLVKEILNVFNINLDNKTLPNEMKSMSSALITISKAIEDLRSDKTLHHGQDSTKYLIDQPLYAYFVVNACATLGLFLIDFYENKFPKSTLIDNVFDDLPF